MKPRLSLRFVDFWKELNPLDNYFSRILERHFTLDFSDPPDVVFYSFFGQEHRKFDHCLKIYFTGENERPNRFECDYFIGFDYPKDPTSFRWPLYNLYPQDPLPPVPKEKFCSVLVSNPHNKLRLEFIRRLAERRPVDSGGKLVNNVGGPVQDKMEFIRHYRFNIAIENSSYPGYTTEKLFEAKMAGCIPIYWGDPRLAEDFNPDAAVNLANYPNLDACIDDILAIDADPKRLIALQQQPLWPLSGQRPHSDLARLEAFLVTAVRSGRRRVRSRSLGRLAHRWNLRNTKAYDRKAQAGWMTVA